MDMPAAGSIHDSGIPELPAPVALEGTPQGEAGESLKPPEIERSLDRAKENLVAYVGERHPKFNEALLRKAIDFTILAHNMAQNSPPFFNLRGWPYTPKYGISHSKCCRSADTDDG